MISKHDHYLTKITMTRFSLVLICVAMAFNCQSEIITDGSLGPNANIGITSTPAPAYLIYPNFGQQQANNLFHSFQNFNVEAGVAAVFLGPGNIQNIISRVTGGSASTIDGTLVSAINGANLYFLNPAGILFGNNSSLQVTGSAHFSTAAFLELGSDGKFDAIQPQNSVLSTSAPSAFGFLNNPPATIAVNGSNLNLPDGQTLSMIGGHLFISGYLYTSDGTINLSALDKQGTIKLTTDGIQSETTSTGKITMLNGIADVSGLGTGKINVFSGSLDMNNSFIASVTYGAGNTAKANIHLDGDINLSNGSTITMISDDYTDQQGNVLSKAIGKSGDIIVSANNINLTDSSRFEAFTLSDGNAGDITVTATNKISLSKSQAYTNPTAFGSFTSSKGQAGNIHITAKELDVDGQSSITVDANNSTGNGGNLTLIVDTIRLTNGAQVQAGTRAAGNAGIITVNANDITVSGFSTDNSGTFSSGFFTPTLGSGNAGQLTITANTLNAENKATLSSLAYQPSSGNGGNITLNIKNINLKNDAKIDSAGTGKGEGGNISINADTISLDKSSLTVSTTDIGNGGKLTANTQTLNIKNSGFISATSSGSGNAGTIIIQATNQIDLNKAKITSETRQSGTGGNINISTPTLNLDDASILVSTKGSGNGGIFTTDLQALSITNKGFISATSTGAGKAGTITIESGKNVSLNDASITSDSQNLGDGGNININTPLLSLDNASINVSTSGSGKGGTFNSNLQTLNLTNQGFISATSTGAGNAGTMTIQATNQIDLNNAKITSETSQSGTGGNIDFTTPNLNLNNSSILVSTKGSGNGGTFTTDLQTLNITNTGSISATSTGSGKAGTIAIQSSKQVQLNNAKITSESQQAGDGGNIDIKGQALTMDNAAILVSASGSGNGGKFNTAVKTLNLKNQGLITATSTGSGDAGTITINASDSIYMENAKITSESKLAGGGNLTVNAKEMIHMKNSTISTSVQGGVGNAGSISIDPVFVILENSLIKANAINGNGGSINIQAQHFYKDNTSDVIASSEKGIDGTIEIISPITGDQQTEAVLPQNFFDASSLLANTCTSKQQNTSKSQFDTRESGYYNHQYNAPDLMNPSLSYHEIIAIQ